MQTAARKKPRMMHSWDEIPMSMAAREEVIYGEDEVLEMSWEERLEKAQRIARRAPWGLRLLTFPSPYYATIGNLEARRKMSGGPWKLKHWGEELSSTSLVELFLQVVERLDSARAGRATPASDIVFTAHSPRRGDCFESWSGESSGDSIKSRTGRGLPSAGYYGDQRAHRVIRTAG